MAETETAPRRAAVSTSDILKAYIPGAKAGKTRDEIAAEVGMTPDSFGVRVSNIRKALREQNPPVELPKLKGSRPSTDWSSLADEARQLMGGDDDDDNE